MEKQSVALIFEVLAADLAQRSLIERSALEEVAERLQATLRACQCKVVDLLQDKNHGL